MISVDRRTVIQILGTLMNRPYLLNDIDKYQIDPNEFCMPLDKYIYSSIYNLYAGGAEIIHAIDIDTYLQTNDLAKKILEEKRDYEHRQIDFKYIITYTFKVDCFRFCSIFNCHLIFC